MSLGLFWAMVWRQARGARGRLLFFATCVATGVAAVVGVAALVEQIEHGLQVRSRELLGGDLAVDSRNAVPDVLPLLAAETHGLPVSHVEVRVLSSVVRSERGKSRLAELKAVADPERVFPLAGALELSPRQPLHELLRDDSVLVARAFLDARDVAIGDMLYVGGVAFRVAGVIEREPDPLTATFVFGPRVLMTAAGLERTQLLTFGHRVRYRTLLRFDAPLARGQLDAIKQHLEHKLPGGGSYVRVETHRDGQPDLRRLLERVREYLGLVALLSLLIAAAGVAQIVSAWLAQSVGQTAVLRCLGLRPREVLWLYVAQIFWLAALGSLAGATFGALVPWLVARAYPDLLSSQGLAWIPVTAVLRGCGLGIGMSLIFSLPPLTAVWKVSPALVLRAEAAPLPAPRFMRAGATAIASLGVLLAAYYQSASWTRALWFTLAVAVLCVGLWLGARALLWSVGRLPRESMPALLWQGAAALLRPGVGVVSSIVALGMGNLVVLAIGLLQGVLHTELATALPEDAPSVFMLDIQTDEWNDVQRALDAASATHVQRVPVVMARLSAVDGRGVDELVQARARGKSDQERERWVLTREQRITSMAQLPDNNHVVQGKLWGDPKQPNEMSVETEFARDLGVHLGSKLRFDVQGVPVDFVITSIRSVEWRRFAVSFFLVAEPGSLDGAPQFVLGAAKVPRAKQQRLQDELARVHPNVTMVQVQELLERASEIVTQLGLAIRLLGAFAMLTGLIILAGSVAATQLRRAREVALLKTLGVTRIRVAAMFAVEYMLLGLVAGAISAAGAYGLTLSFTRGVLDLTTWPSLTLCVVGVFAVALLSVVAGLLASTRALTVAPLEVFRQQS